jgi:hypothetical protein
LEKIEPGCGVKTTIAAVPECAPLAAVGATLPGESEVTEKI